MESEKAWIDGLISIYPCRACDRRRRGIKIDLPFSPRSIINTLLKTYWGTEEWRMKLFCSPFVSVALPRCLLGNIVINAKQVHQVMIFIIHIPFVRFSLQRFRHVDHHYIFVLATDYRKLTRHVHKETDSNQKM